MNLRRAAVAAAATTTLLLTAACGGGGDPLDDSGGGGDGGGDKGTVVLSGQNFTEMRIMAAMYQLLLENEGYTVDQRLVDTRDIYFPQLSSGDVQVVPEYLAGVGDYLNTEQNGPDADPVTTNDTDETLQAVQPLAEEAGVELLEPAEATDQNAFAVTEEFAEQNDLETLSDLAGLNQPIVLAAAPDCEDRQDCAAGLTSVYDLDITQVLPLGFGSAQTKNAVTTGDAELGQVATTDGALEDDSLELLEDDQGLQPAQNLVPAVNADWLADNQDAADALNSLSDELDTDDLAELNTRVDRDREQPADVAQSYLEDAGLLS